MTSLELLLHCASSAATHMRGRDTDEQTLKRIEALFFEVYTGPYSVPNGYKEVDNALYATSLATVPQQMLPLSCCSHAFSCAASPRYVFAQVLQVSTYSRRLCAWAAAESRCQWCRQHWQDSPESTRTAYRSALKAWLDYCDLLRRIDPAATNAPWPDTKVLHCLLQPLSRP